MADQLFGCSCGHDPSAGLTAFGSEVDHPVRFSNQLEVMFDHQDRMPAIDQALEHFDQPPHIGAVQANRGFFEDEEIALRGAMGGGRPLLQPGQQMGYQLDALGLAAAEGRAGLPQLEVIQTGVVQGVQGAVDAGLGGEERPRLGYAQLQHLRDVLAVELDLESLAVESQAAAAFAPHERRWQEVHLEFDHARPFALGTPALPTVKGNQTTLETTLQNLFRQQGFSPSAHGADTGAPAGAQSESIGDSLLGVCGGDAAAGGFSRSPVGRAVGDPRQAQGSMVR